MSVPAHYKTFANALAEGKPYLTTATDTVLVVHEAWGGGCFGILPLLVPGKVSHNAEAAVFIV